MDLSRRAFVAAAALCGGCLGSGSSTPTPRPDSDGDGVPDDADDYPNDERLARWSSSSEGVTTLEPGEFNSWALTNGDQTPGEYVHYDVTVSGEGRADCLVLARDAYDAFVDGARDVSLVSAYSRTDVSEATVTERLDGGEYLFVLDYTGLGSDPGADSVEVEYTVEVAEPP
jgi:hypothetical protein